MFKAPTAMEYRKDEWTPAPGAVLMTCTPLGEKIVSVLPSVVYLWLLRAIPPSHYRPFWSHFISPIKRQIEKRDTDRNKRQKQKRDKGRKERRRRSQCRGGSRKTWTCGTLHRQLHHTASQKQGNQWAVDSRSWSHFNWDAGRESKGAVPQERRIL